MGPDFGALRPGIEERSSGLSETYVEAGRRGKNTWPRYLLGVVFILFMWFGLAVVAGLVGFFI